MKTALIAGATGMTGSELLNLLIGNNDYDTIYLFVRNSINPVSKKIKEYIINFDELTKMKIDGQIDHVYCTLGTTIKKAGTKENFYKVDYKYVIDLGNFAKVSGAKKFMVVSSLGANVKSPFYYSRVKGEMEATLKEISIPHLFIFRPSLLIGRRTEKRPGEQAATEVYKILSPVFTGPFKKFKGIDVKKVANAMMQAALKNEESLKIFESDEIQNY